METRRPQGEMFHKCFTQFRVFPIFTSVDITVYQYGKNVLYFFYNVAQRTLTEESTRLLANQRTEFSNATLQIDICVQQKVILCDYYICS